jgi:hypothetical protein
VLILNRGDGRGVTCCTSKLGGASFLELSVLTKPAGQFQARIYYEGGTYSFSSFGMGCVRELVRL